MVNKTININSVVNDKNNKLKDVVNMNCNIGTDLSSFNISVYVNDKDLYAENKEEIKEKFNEFMKTALLEVVNSGWDAFKLNLK